MYALENKHIYSLPCSVKQDYRIRCRVSMPTKGKNTQVKMNAHLSIICLQRTGRRQHDLMILPQSPVHNYIKSGNKLGVSFSNKMKTKQTSNSDLPTVYVFWVSESKYYSQSSNQYSNEVSNYITKQIKVRQQGMMQFKSL